MIVMPASSMAGHGVASNAGLVQGSTVRARHLEKDLTARLKNLAGVVFKDDCGLVIPEQRLRARPAATRCLDCQSVRDQQQVA